MVADMTNNSNRNSYEQAYEVRDDTGLVLFQGPWGKCQKFRTTSNRSVAVLKSDGWIIDRVRDGVFRGVMVGDTAVTEVDGRYLVAAGTDGRVIGYRGTLADGQALAAA